MNVERKSRAAGDNPAGENGAEQLTLDYSQCSTSVPTRQDQLKQYDAAMTAAHRAGDIDSFCDAWQAWLNTFCRVGR